MSMESKLYEKASIEIPGDDCNNFILRPCRNAWCMGYDKALDEAHEWWKSRLHGFVSDDIAEGIVNEFCEDMEGNYE